MIIDHYKILKYVPYVREIWMMSTTLTKYDNLKKGVVEDR